MEKIILLDLVKIFALISYHKPNLKEAELDYVSHFIDSKVQAEEKNRILQTYQDCSTKITTDAHQEIVKITRDAYKNLPLRLKTVFILELLLFCKKFYSLENKLIDQIVLEVGISSDLFQLISNFLDVEELPHQQTKNTVLLVGDDDAQTDTKIHKYHVKKESGMIFCEYIPSIHMFLIKNISAENVFINNKQVEKSHIGYFTVGSSLRFPNGKQIYYSELRFFLSPSTKSEQIQFIADKISYQFTDQENASGILSIAEKNGSFVGIIGASGAGKTTLLNIFAGLQKPKVGQVCVNDIDIYTNPKKIAGIIGYVGQDDILFENLTVYENLFFNAKLCFGDKSNSEITQIIDSLLNSLDLQYIKHLAVGNMLNKKISGGQRKRLTLAMDLMREPHLLFVDEPTSGLSSNDSKNIIRLLKELALRGKLVFAVIHQPSAETFHGFDKILVLDTGGIPVFYGNPKESISYFSSQDLTPKFGQEPHSSQQSNPDIILEVLESKVLDDFGAETNTRKWSPADWYKKYQAQEVPITNLKYSQNLESNLKVPSKIRQLQIYFYRDFLVKWKNKLYVFFSFVQAPLLALALSLVLKHDNNIDNTKYIYGYNDNIPAFILIAVIVALFLGLTNSVQEINKDKKIRKREQFLTLSRNSYLLSKISVLFIFSAIQMFLFVLVSSEILQIKGMIWNYWLILFAISCGANLIGLCISDAIEDVRTAYILIPIFLIPQLVLCGALFDFDKLNQKVSAYGKTPIIADMMLSRWGLEALAVWQDKENEYNKHYFEVDKEISKLNYLKNYWLPEVHKFYLQNPKSTFVVTELNDFNSVYATDCNSCYTIESIQHYLFDKKRYYTHVKDRLTQKIIQSGTDVHLLKEKYYNENLHLMVRHYDAEHRILSQNGHLIQNFDPIYLAPRTEKTLNWRAPMYVSSKNLFGNKIHTFWFDFLVLWLIVLVLYLILYLELFKSCFGQVEKFTLYIYDKFQ